MQAVDTVFVVAPPATRSVAADWAIVFLGAVAAVALVAALPLIIQLRKGVGGLRRASRELERKADPLLERGKAVGANLEFITTTLKHDVESLNGAIRSLSDRLTQASDRMEERINDFNALMEVVQGEAEGVFVETAATARGVRAGARHLTGTDRPRSGESSGELPPSAPQPPPPDDSLGDEVPDVSQLAPGAPSRPHGDALPHTSVRE
jgi:hypothetical protein